MFVTYRVLYAYSADYGFIQFVGRNSKQSIYNPSECRWMIPGTED